MSVRLGKTGFVLIAAVVIVAVQVGFLLCDRPGPAAKDHDRQVVRSRRIASVEGKTRREMLIRPADVREGLRPSGEAQDAKVAGSADVADADDEKLFDQVVAGLVSELSRASREKNVSRLREIIGKLKALGGKGYALLAKSKIPVVAIKSKILEGLGALGPEAVDEVLEFLGDEDSMVSQSAANSLFEIIQDLALGDYRLGEIVAEAATELKDEYAITQLYNQFLRMRHSVGCGVFADIMANGTAQAKAALPRAIGAFTSDVSITTVEQLNEWLAENPDSALDDHMYGPLNVQKID